MKLPISDTIKRYFKGYLNNYKFIDLPNKTAERVRRLLVSTEKPRYIIEDDNLTDILTLYAYLAHKNKILSELKPSLPYEQDELNILEFFRELNKDFTVDRIIIKAIKKGISYKLDLKTDEWKGILFEILSKKIEDETDHFFKYEVVKYHHDNAKKREIVRRGRKPYSRSFDDFRIKMVEYLKNEKILNTQIARDHFTGQIFQLAGIYGSAVPGRQAKHLKHYKPKK